MGDKEKKRQYDLEYAKKHLKRIPLDVKIDKYDDIRKCAENSGESVNGYIKRAIDERIERDTGTATKAAVKTEKHSNNILSPDTLKTAQKAGELTGETPPQFVERAVQTQAKRDKVAIQMGINPLG